MVQSVVFRKKDGNNYEFTTISFNKIRYWIVYYRQSLEESNRVNRVKMQSIHAITWLGEKWF